MAFEMRTRAYAKVNFALNVLPKRSDGFHDLESIFQTIDLWDELVVSKRSDKGCLVECDDMALPKENTLTSAYEAFCDVTGWHDFGVAVRLFKGIPSCGGLGGGSSDAAGLIRVLQNLSSIVLSPEEIAEVSGRVGSDVFFFTHFGEKGTGAAIVSGRGDVVKSIKGRDDLFLLLVFPGVGSSTKLAYSMIDEMFAKGIVTEGPRLAELESIYNSPPEKWSFVNAFTPGVSERYPEIAKAIKNVRDAGALYAELSGSGSTVFGIFTSMQQAMYSRDLLATEWNCKVVKIVC